MQNLREPTMETGEPSYFSQMIQFDTSGDEMEHPHYDRTLHVVQDNPRQIEQLSSVLPNSRKPKARNSTQPKRTFKGPKQRPWTDTETSALLKFVNLPKFRHPRRTRGTVAWELIVEAIHGELGSPDPAITVKRCKERMKTLTGDRYYKQARSNWEKKNLGGSLTQDDWPTELENCGLTVGWYKAIEEYMQGRPSHGHGVSRMQMQGDLGRMETTDCPSSSDGPTFNDPPEPVSAMVPAQDPRKSAKNEIRRRFKFLNNWQRSTLLDLIFLAINICPEGSRLKELDVVSRCCELLAIVQNRRESAVYDDVVVLKKMWLVSLEGNSEDVVGEGSDEDEVNGREPRIEWSGLRVYEEFSKKVIARNIAYDTRRAVEDETMLKFDSSFAPLRITMLSLDNCEELMEADLSGFRMLRYLSIRDCQKLHKIIWCEHLEELGSVDVARCDSYHGYPPLQRMPYLEEFLLWERGEPCCERQGGELDLSGCVRLRRLEIYADTALSSIRGLEGLRSLSILSLWLCPALESLPDIGHMKDLTHLELGFTHVAQIMGVENLSKLRVLDCEFSQLKTLPDLSHLPHLRAVRLRSCPVIDDPSSPYYQKSNVKLNKNKYVDVSDASDDEGDVSC